MNVLVVLLNWDNRNIFSWITSCHFAPCRKPRIFVLFSKYQKMCVSKKCGYLIRSNKCQNEFIDHSHLISYPSPSLSRTELNRIIGLCDTAEDELITAWKATVSTVTMIPTVRLSSLVIFISRRMVYGYAQKTNWMNGDFVQFIL